MNIKTKSTIIELQNSSIEADEGMQQDEQGYGYLTQEKLLALYQQLLKREGAIQTEEKSEDGCGE